MRSDILIDVGCSIRTYEPNSHQTCFTNNMLWLSVHAGQIASLQQINKGYSTTFKKYVSPQYSDYVI